MSTYTPEQWAVIMAAHENRERIARRSSGWLLPKVTETTRPEPFPGVLTTREAQA